MNLTKILNKECDIGDVLDGILIHPCGQEGKVICDNRAYLLCEKVYVTYAMREKKWKKVNLNKLEGYK